MSRYVDAFVSLEVNSGLTFHLAQMISAEGTKRHDLTVIMMS